MQPMFKRERQKGRQMRNHSWNEEAKVFMRDSTETLKAVCPS
jgi:hypothetical protein